MGSIANADAAEYGEAWPSAIVPRGSIRRRSKPADCIQTLRGARSGSSPMPQLSDDHAENSGTMRPARRAISDLDRWRRGRGRFRHRIPAAPAKDSSREMPHARNQKNILDARAHATESAAAARATPRTRSLELARPQTILPPARPRSARAARAVSHEGPRDSA